MLAVVDHEHRILHAGPALERMLGRGGAELRGTSIDAFLVAPGPLQSAVRDALARRASSRVALRFVGIDGAPVEAAIHVVPLPVGSAAMLLDDLAMGEEQLSAIADVLDRISDGFVAFDRSWRYTYVNRAAEEFYGRPRRDLVGRVVWDEYPRSRGTDLERALRRAIATRMPLEVEQISPQFGRWIAYRAFPTGDGLAMVFRDTTEEHQLRDELREREERQRALLENSFEGILLTAPDGRILDANPAAVRMLRRTRDEICRAGRAGVVDGSDPRLAEFLAERRRTGVARGEITLVRGDGTLFPARVSSTIFRDAHGEERTSMVFWDVTEERRAEDALTTLAEAGEVLARSLDVEGTLENLTRTVVPRLADVCMVELVEDGTVRGAAAAHRDREHDLASLRARPWPDGVARVIASGEALLAEVVDERWLRDVAGAGRGALERARAVGATSALVVPLVARGRILGSLALASTDTARRFDRSSLVLVRALGERAALAIDNARQYLAAVEAKRLRDEVLAIVAHDLRNPLSAIAVAAGLLGREVASPHLGTIGRAVSRADRLIDDLLLASAIDAGKLPLDRRLEPIAPLLDELMAVHAPLAHAKRIHLETRVAPRVSQARIDRHRVLQMLGNFVGNAIRLTPEGGRVEIEARVDRGFLELEVRDTGPGIAPADLAHLFDRFWQSARAHRGGAGLGLAIAKGIAEAHGGAIGVESELGHGARFTVRLPLDVPAELRPERAH